MREPQGGAASSTARSDVSLSVVFSLFNARDCEGLLGVLVGARDPEARRIAAGMLGNLGYQPALEPLIHVLRTDESVEVREGAAKGLMNLKTPSGIQALRDAADDPDETVRDAAEFALQHLSMTSGLEELFAAERGGDVESLLTKARDELVGTRVEALRALGRLGDPRGIPGIAAIVADEAEEVEARKAGVRALGGIADRTDATAMSPTLAESLLIAVRSEDPDLRAYAMQALVVAGPENHSLIGALTSPDRQERNRALEALTDAIRFGSLKSDARTRRTLRAAVKAAWASGTESMSLLGLLREVGDEAGAAAVLAAIDLGDPTVVERRINEL